MSPNKVERIPGAFDYGNYTVAQHIILHLLVPQELEVFGRFYFSGDPSGDEKRKIKRIAYLLGSGKMDSSAVPPYFLNRVMKSLETSCILLPSTKAKAAGR